MYNADNMEGWASSTYTRAILLHVLYPTSRFVSSHQLTESNPVFTIYLLPFFLVLNLLWRISTSIESAYSVERFRLDCMYLP